MPEGVGYQLWTDQNPPRGDDPILQEGYLWDHPQMGKVFYDPKQKGFVPVTNDTWWDSNLRPAAPVAEEQAVAVEAVPAPVEGVAPSGITAGETEANLAGRSGQERGLERQRARRVQDLAQTTAVGDLQATAAGVGPFAGFGVGERTAAQALVNEGMTPEEAADEIRRRKGATAEEQAVAVEGAP